MSEPAIKPFVGGSDTTDCPPLDCPVDNGALAPGSLINGSSIEHSLAKSAAEQRLLEREIAGRRLLANLREHNREAFRGDLAKWLLGAPSVDDIAVYAAKNPDRWAQGLAVMARLSGYTERPDEPSQVTNILVQIGRLSDSDLLSRLDALDAQVQAGRSTIPTTIEGEIIAPDAAMAALIE